MKKLNKILLSTAALIVSAFAISGNNQSSNVPAFEETPTNEVSRGLAMKLAQIDASEEVSVSKTYVQHGEDAEGNRYIRYVTAIKGDIKSLQYVRKCYDLEESQQTATKNVTTVYKGVMANGEVQYYNGTDFDTNPNTDYYLACYQIKIRPESYETYKHHRWEVSLQVDTDGDASTYEHTTNARTGILEKLTPEVTFNNVIPTNEQKPGHYYSTDLDWMHTVTSDVEYVVTYDCGDKGITGATTPENNGSGWSQVIDTVENDVYKATHVYSPWFWYEGESNVEIRGFRNEKDGSDFSVADASDRNYAMDKNPDTALWVLWPDRDDAYIEWTLDEPVNLRNIEILLGKDGSGADAFYSTLSVSADKKSYTTIGDVNEIEKFFNVNNLNLTGIKYIRLTNTGDKSLWVAVREIIINTEETESIFSSVTYENFFGYQEGRLSNLYDGDDQTYVRFQPNDEIRENRYIKLELTRPMNIYAIKLLNGDNNLGDAIKGRVLVSSDDEVYEQFGNDFDKESVVNLEEDYAVNIKYIKIHSEYTGTYWTALREIVINETPNNGAVKSFTNAVIHNNNISSFALDGDKNTFAWYKPVESPSVFTLEFDFFKVQDINTIKILMGNEVSPADLLYNMTFYYSVDGVDYTKINETEESYVSMDYLYRLDETVQARYIKVESNRINVTNWIVIREFQVGMDLKLDPTISFGIESGTELTQGSQVSYTINGGLEHSVYFESENGDIYDYNEGVVPSEPGYYSLVVDVPGNDKYNPAHVWATYKVVANAAE